MFVAGCKPLSMTFRSDIGRARKGAQTVGRSLNFVSFVAGCMFRLL